MMDLEFQGTQEAMESVNRDREPKGRIATDAGESENRLPGLTDGMIHNILP